MNAMDADKFATFREVIENAIPFNRELGLRLLEADDGRARLRFDFREALVGNFITRVLHGGVISSALDVIGACAVMSTFTSGEPLYGIGTVDMRIDFLRPGAGSFFIASGEVMRPGRILSAARMELHNDQDTLIAIGTAIYRASRKVEDRPPNL
jgi:uncharacterized protein (TIGR00369 family)